MIVIDNKFERLMKGSGRLVWEGRDKERGKAVVDMDCTFAVYQFACKPMHHVVPKTPPDVLLAWVVWFTVDIACS